MGEIKKINNEYYIEFYARGLKYQQKAGTNYDEAKKMLKEVEEKIQNGEMEIIVRDVDFVIFFEDFLLNAKDEHTPESFKRYKSLITDFQKFLKIEVETVTKLSDVTPKVIEEFLVYLKKTNTTPAIINLSLVLLKDVFEYARKLGHLNDNPTLHARLVEDPELKKNIPDSLVEQAQPVPNLKELEEKLKNALAAERQDRDLIETLRSLYAREAIQRKTPISKLYQMLGFDDIKESVVYFYYAFANDNDTHNSAHGI